ncbi:IS630 family transposase [Alicyclobacillus suci]|uniref:IS630 family transposase n=1 Tax=Alicyclobacillus suci TaxID=2816080 RepID=UPI002E2E4B87|nr:IS630 family transposase [Alicyclobacillus suci]
MQSLYNNPPKDGRVICLDEFEPLSIQPFAGRGWFVKRKPSRLPATYHRTHGVRHLLAALDLKSDKLYGHVSNSKKHQDILRFLKVLRRRYHRSERLYIILDNFSPHKHERVRNWAVENNVELVYTPTHASWLNRIECHFGPLRKFVLSGSNYENHKALGDAIRAYIRWRNKHRRNASLLREQKKIKVV